MRLCAATIAIMLCACGGGDGDDEEFPSIFPEQGYTGFDGGAHTFRIPVSASLDGDVTWSSESAAIVTIAAVTPPAELAMFAENWAMVTATGVGSTRIFVDGSQRLEARITVVSYDPADVTLGDERYNNPANPGPANRVSCASCHQTPTGADHSPLVVAFRTDAELLAAITTGRYPDGGLPLEVPHSWDLTVAERDGIVAYLRTLDADGF